MSSFQKYKFHKKTLIRRNLELRVERNKTKWELLVMKLLAFIEFIQAINIAIHGRENNNKAGK